MCIVIPVERLLSWVSRLHNSLDWLNVSFCLAFKVIFGTKHNTTSNQQENRLSCFYSALFSLADYQKKTFWRKWWPLKRPFVSQYAAFMPRAPPSGAPQLAGDKSVACGRKGVLGLTWCLLQNHARVSAVSHWPACFEVFVAGPDLREIPSARFVGIYGPLTAATCATCKREDQLKHIMEYTNIHEIHK